MEFNEDKFIHQYSLAEQILAITSELLKQEDLSFSNDTLTQKCQEIKLNPYSWVDELIELDIIGIGGTKENLTFHITPEISDLYFINDYELDIECITEYIIDHNHAYCKLTEEHFFAQDEFLSKKYDLDNEFNNYVHKKHILTSGARLVQLALASIPIIASCFIIFINHNYDLPEYNSAPSPQFERIIEQLKSDSVLQKKLDSMKSHQINQYK